MRILTKYITRELLVAMALGLMLFSVIFVIQAFFKGMDLLLMSEFSALTIFKMLAIILPPLLILILPISLLMAIIAIYGKFSEEREISAMLMSGMNYKKLLKPAIVIGIICTIFLLIWCEVVVPKSVQIQNEMLVSFIQNLSITGLLREGSFISKFENMIFHVHKIDPVTNVLEKISIFIYRNEKVLGLIIAPAGKVDFDPDNLLLNIKLSNGAIYEPITNKEVGVTKFEEFNFLIDVKRRLYQYYQELDALEGLHRSELKELIDIQKRDNIKSIAGYPRWYDTSITMHQRLSFPFACLLMAFVGVPVGLMIHKGKKAWVFIVTILIVFLYYSILLIGQALIKSSVCNVLIGMWLPNVFLLGFGLVANWLVARR